MIEYENDEKPLISPNEPLLESSVLITNDDRIKKMRMKSIWIINSICLLSSISFSICMPSLWPYLKEMNKDSTTFFFGWLVGSYSIGQLVSSPIFGYLFQKYKRATFPILMALFINCLGSIYYCLIADIHKQSYRSYALMTARIIVGFGAGVMGVIRSYIAQASTVSERTFALSITVAAQSIGFVIGPGLQALCGFIGYPGPVDIAGFHLNTYTSPGFIGILMSLLSAVLLIFFQEWRQDLAGNWVQVRRLPGRLVNSDRDAIVNDSDIQSLQASVEHRVLPGIDYMVVAVLLGKFFVLQCLFSLLETLLTPLLMDEYAYSKSQATFISGILLAVSGAISVIFIFVSQYFIRRFKLQERRVMIFCFTLCLINYIIWLPWGSTYPPIRFENIHNATSFALQVDDEPALEPGWQDHLNSTYFDQHQEQEQLVGCSLAENKWCDSIPQINFYQLLVGFYFSSCGYVMAMIMVNSFFSKALGPVNQGVWMGILSAVGSLARFSGPLVVGFLYSGVGPRVIFIVMIGLQAACILLCFIFYKRLVPRLSRYVSLDSPS